MLDEQAKHLSYIIGHSLENQVRVVEASAEAEADWVRTIVGLAVTRRLFLPRALGGIAIRGQSRRRARRSGGFGRRNERRLT